MKQFLEIPPVEDAPARLFETGHLWILEWIDGLHLRFRLRESGLIQFGDRTRVYDDPDAVPAPYQHAVRHVRTNLDRDALRAAVDDVTEIVFFGEATTHVRTDYEYERMPSFLGFDVWSAEAGRFRPPDAAAGIFERLGLTPVNSIEQELPARDFRPDDFEIPRSAWYDGPAAGVVIRNKRSDRAIRYHLDRAGDGTAVDRADNDETSADRVGDNDTNADHVDNDETNANDVTAEALAATYAARRRLEAIGTKLESRGRPVAADALYERVLEQLHREAHGTLSNAENLERSEIRSAVAARTRSFLDEK